MTRNGVEDFVRVAGRQIVYAGDPGPKTSGSLGLMASAIALRMRCASRRHRMRFEDRSLNRRSRGVQLRLTSVARGTDARVQRRSRESDARRDVIARTPGRSNGGDSLRARRRAIAGKRHGIDAELRPNVCHAGSKRDPRRRAVGKCGEGLRCARGALRVRDRHDAVTVGSDEQRTVACGSEFAGSLDRGHAFDGEAGRNVGQVCRGDGGVPERSCQNGGEKRSR